MVTYEIKILKFPRNNSFGNVFRNMLLLKILNPHTSWNAFMHIIDAERQTIVADHYTMHKNNASHQLIFPIRGQ